MSNSAVIKFNERCTNAAKLFLDLKPARVVVLHHNDSDGLTSGAILGAALERLHVPHFRYCLEKPYPAVLEQIFANPLLEPNTIFLFVDFASGMLETVNRINQKRYQIFILDHHSIVGSPDEYLTLVNCNDAGVNGSLECSASSVAYLFAVALAADNTDLLAAGLLGGMGDGHFSDEADATGVHAALYAAALQTGIIDAEGRFSLPHEGATSEIIASIDALGSAGYFHGGPDIAVKGILEGFDSRYHAYGRQYQEQYFAALNRFLAEDTLHIKGDLAWFRLPADFQAFGVKTVGLVSQHLADNDERCRDRYVIGFQQIPDRIPGLGDIPLAQVKLSMRVGSGLRPAVLGEERPTIQVLIPRAATVVPAFVDACHRHAGAATIKPGAEQQFVTALGAALNELQDE